MREKKNDNALVLWKNVFEIWFKKEKSEVFRDIFREVYRDDYPEEVITDSYVTLTDLRTIVKTLNVGSGNTFIDLGCGRGGPGLWIARETGANLVGIDFSENAIKHANKLTLDFNIDGTAKFQVGNIFSLDFPENSFDGAVSIDVIMFIPDPLAAIREVARILRPNSFFVFTAWEVKVSRRYKDYRPHLQDSDFKIISYSETPNWKQRQREVYQKTLELQDLLIKDMGRDGAFLPIKEAKDNLPILDNLRRILVVAMKM